jgi:hypothetical protein
LTLLGEDNISANSYTANTVSADSESWDWFWDTIEGMGKNDAYGGMLGLVGCPGGAVGATCYSSAVSGLESLIDRIISWF